MAKKLFDVCVANGSYEKDGQSKSKWIQVGVVMEKEEGKAFMLLERTFNPAGVQALEGKTTILLNLFKPKQKDNAPEQQTITPEDIAWQD